MSKHFNYDLFNKILEILNGRKLTGYEVYKFLQSEGIITSKRLVYYYLSIGLKKGYLKVETVDSIGKYSWGEVATKKYYSRLDQTNPSSN